MNEHRQGQQPDLQQRLLEAEIQLDKNNLGDAEKLFQEILEQDPNNAKAWSKLGVAKIRMGDKAAAKECWEMAIRLDDKIAPAYSNLGNLAKEAGNLDQAIEFYKRAIKADPDFPTAYHNLGVALREKGDIGESINNLKKAARLQRNYAKSDLQKVPKKQRNIAWAIMVGLGVLIFYLISRSIGG